MKEVKRVKTTEKFKVAEEVEITTIVEKIRMIA